MAFLRSLTTRRLAIASVLSLAGSAIAFVLAWADIELGFLRCDMSFGPFEKPGCRLAWAYLWMAYALFVVALVGVVVVLARTWQVWRRGAGAPTSPL